jgi:mono/diheme cytochrome c family protein
MFVDHHVGRAAGFLTVVAVVLMSGAAPAKTKKSAPAGKDNSVYAELAKAPRKAAARPNPLATDPEAVTAGGKLFAQHCAECHGEMAEGGKKAPSLLAPEVQQATPGTLFWLLTNGVVRRGMPVWSKLPEPQRWQLVSYIKSLTPVSKRTDGEKAPAERGSPSHPQVRRP